MELTVQHYLSLSETPEEAQALLRYCSLIFGEAYDSMLNTEDDREIFISPQIPGAITFCRVGQDAEMLGGLCAPENRKKELLCHFVQFLQTKGLALSTFNVPENDVEIFRDSGFKVTKLGEELYLPLRTHNWNGKAFWKFRNKVNKCRKLGMTVQEILAEDYNITLPELTEITKSQLSEKAQKKSLCFFVGQCPPKNILDKRIFVARSLSGKIEAFVVLIPYKNGKAFGLDSFRFRPDAARNVMPFLLKNVTDCLQKEGIMEFSLGAAPGAGCHQKIKNDKAAIRLSVHFLYQYFSFLYDLKGVYEFKNQFRPERRNLYICIYPDQFTFNGIYAFFKTFGLFDISFRIIFKRLFKKISHSVSRKMTELRKQTRSFQWRITN